MTLKQQSFIDSYTDINNKKTFGNNTQSYMIGYRTDNSNVAAVEGHRLLSNPNVLSEVEQRLAEINMGPKVRLKAVSDIITGRHKKTSKTTVLSKDGQETYTSTTESSPSAAELIKAVDVIERITGTYDKNKAKADIISADMKAIIRRHRKELKQDGVGGKEPPRDI